MNQTVGLNTPKNALRMTAEMYQCKLVSPMQQKNLKSIKVKQEGDQSDDWLTVGYEEKELGQETNTALKIRISFNIAKQETEAEITNKDWIYDSAASRHFCVDSS